MSAPNPYLSVQQLSIRIDDELLLDAVDLTIKKGQKIAITGANGAGKTTLLRCLLGLLKPHSGKVLLEGSDIHSLARNTIARKIAYVPQGISSEIPFPVQDFLLMSRYSHSGLSQGFIPSDHDGEEVAQTMMMRTGITHLKHRLLNTLSGGERQKVCIAAALTQQAPILALDEPATHLDPKQQDSIQELLDEIHQSHEYTIITVTHDLNWAASHHDRLIGLKQGRIIADASPEEYMTTENLAAIFDTQWEIYPHPRTRKPMIIH